MPEVVELQKPVLVQTDSGKLEMHFSSSTISDSVAGSADVHYYFYDDHALKGEDYPALVRVWDNDDDAIYDAI